MESQFLLRKSGPCHLGNPSRWWMAILALRETVTPSLRTNPLGLGGLVVLWWAGGIGLLCLAVCGEQVLGKTGSGSKRKRNWDTGKHVTPDSSFSGFPDLWECWVISVFTYWLVALMSVYTFLSDFFFFCSQRRLYSLLKIQKTQKNTEKEIKTLHKLPTPPGDNSYSYFFVFPSFFVFSM